MHELITPRKQRFSAIAGHQGNSTLTQQDISALTFDVGNTILTPAAPEYLTVVNIAQSLGIKLVAEDVKTCVPKMYALYEHLYAKDSSFWEDDGRTIKIWHDMYEYLCNLLGVTGKDAKNISHAVFEYYLNPQSWAVFDDVMQTLDKLQARGYKMALISNWDASLVSIINGMGLGRYFSAIISSADASCHKPHTEIFQLCLQQMGVAPNEVLHVGDHISADVEGALVAGMNAAYLNRDNDFTRFETLVSARDSMYGDMRNQEVKAFCVSDLRDILKLF